MLDRQDWDTTWLSIATIMGNRSQCDRRKAGAVIVTQDNQVAGASYNGPPRGQRFVGGCLGWCARAQRVADSGLDESFDELTSYVTCPSIHAEANALLRADRSVINRGTIYVTTSVCMDCAKLIANSGLLRVVMRVRPDDAHRNPPRVMAYLQECGLIVAVRHVET